MDLEFQRRIQDKNWPGLKGHQSMKGRTQGVVVSLYSRLNLSSVKIWQGLKHPSPRSGSASEFVMCYFIAKLGMQNVLFFKYWWSDFLVLFLSSEVLLYYYSHHSKVTIVGPEGKVTLGGLLSHLSACLLILLNLGSIIANNLCLSSGINWKQNLNTTFSFSLREMLMPRFQP